MSHLASCSDGVLPSVVPPENPQFPRYRGDTTGTAGDSEIDRLLHDMRHDGFSQNAKGTVFNLFHVFRIAGHEDNGDPVRLGQFSPDAWPRPAVRQIYVDEGNVRCLGELQRMAASTCKARDLKTHGLDGFSHIKCDQEFVLSADWASRRLGTLVSIGCLPGLGALATSLAVPDRYC